MNQEQAIARELPRERVLKELRSWIDNGRCLPGDLFPTEAEITGELGVSRSTVRVALKALEDAGVLNVSRGRGRVVAPQKSAGLVASAVAIVSYFAGDVDRFRHTGADKAVEAGALDALRAQRMQVLALNLAAEPQVMAHRLISERPLGVICDHGVSMSPGGQQMMRELAQASIPVVGYGDHAELEGFDRAIPNHERGAFELTQWLISKGCKRLLRVWEGSGSGYWVKQRHAGFERAVRLAGLEITPVLTIDGGPGPVFGEDPGFQQVFASRVRYMAGALAEHVISTACPDAIVAMNDATAMVLGAALRLLGKRPNVDILIAGYDHYWPDAVELGVGGVPPMVTVDKHNDKIGESLARLLLDRVRTGISGPPRLVVVDGSLVVSGSDQSEVTSRRRE